MIIQNSFEEGFCFNDTILGSIGNGKIKKIRSKFLIANWITENSGTDPIYSFLCVLELFRLLEIVKETLRR